MNSITLNTDTPKNNPIKPPHVAKLPILLVSMFPLDDPEKRPIISNMILCHRHRKMLAIYISCDQYRHGIRWKYTMANSCIHCEMILSNCHSAVFAENFLGPFHNMTPCANHILVYENLLKISIFIHFSEKFKGKGHANDWCDQEKGRKEKSKSPISISKKRDSYLA